LQDARGGKIEFVEKREKDAFLLFAHKLLMREFMLCGFDVARTLSAHGRNTQFLKNFCKKSCLGTVAKQLKRQYQGIRLNTIKVVD